MTGDRIIGVPVPGGGVMVTDTERNEWLPGLYDSLDTAKRAATLTDSALLDVIRTVVDEDRTFVTLADVEKAMHLEVP